MKKSGWIQQFMVFQSKQRLLLLTKGSLNFTVNFNETFLERSSLLAPDCTITQAYSLIYVTSTTMNKAMKLFNWMNILEIYILGIYEKNHDASNFIKCVLISNEVGEN